MFSTVRFLPKEHGLRPIINLRRKPTKLVNGSSSYHMNSVNRQLRNAFLILAYERQRRCPTSSVTGMNELFQKIKSIKNKLIDPTQESLPVLYMVKVDVKRSFDSINQERLLGLLDSILKEKKYWIYRHSKIVPYNGQVMKRFYPKAMTAESLPRFLDLSHQQAQESKHAVFVDKVVHLRESKASVVQQVREHVQENIVKFGEHYYRQTTGIPQGSILSPALCRFYYDELEMNVLSDFAQADDSALVHYADDFLFISKTKVKAERFLETVAKGYPEYGFYINEAKTTANFNFVVNDVPVQRCQGNDFPYCGMLLNTRTLDIRADYSRYHGEDIRNLLTVSKDRHPGRSITLKMKKAMQYTCQMAFSDTAFNSHTTVLLNIYQSFVFCAMKFHAYVQDLVHDPVTAQDIYPTALGKVAIDIFRTCYGLLHNGRRSTVGVAAQVEFDIPERHVHWLGAMAFCKTLPDVDEKVPNNDSGSSGSSSTTFGGSSSGSRHPVHDSGSCKAIYSEMKQFLKERILDPMDREEKPHFRRRLHSVVHDDRNQILDNIQYL
ncbi:hypothetical protein BGW38_004190 [Lunasporangiospora selenospora]|uniref:Telomerase reverse transcriptase n=1 Tax=Lunasporangiospora selenospora TaxID=979761 RepID=A0A9P6G1D2_9FUNG|nr:hypothetical protein BGW38_004190 [Lunasporangiospora selenospora]